MAPVPVASIFSSTKSQKETKYAVLFFQGNCSQFSTSVLDAQVKGQCVHSGHFSTHPSWRGRDAQDCCPGNRCMGITSRHNSNTATIANPHLSVGTVPKMNSETTDLKSFHLTLIPPLYIHGLSFHRSTDPKLLSN